MGGNQRIKQTGKARLDKVTSIERKHFSGPRPAVEERMAEGKLMRDKVPRASHAKWVPAANRPDPIELLKKSDYGRLPELLPIRYGRMRLSPFAFYRGAAALMAADLAVTPTIGLRVQACGDCHVSNFGGMASPDRRLVFDINDFDETLPAPWEWDVKRLAASVVLAGRQSGAREQHCADVAHLLVESYRTHMRGYARMRALDMWYSRLDAEVFFEEAKTVEDKKHWKQIEDKAKLQTGEHLLPKLTDVLNGQRHIIDHPPFIYHPRQYETRAKEIHDIFHRYRQTLPADRRAVMDRYEIVDIARKVVGIGSVGTRCAVILLMAAEHDPLVLQFKEALPSALEPYAAKSAYRNQGERVVTGQRMLQSGSDVFLGWTRDDHGRDYYFRQLRDMRMKLDLDAMSKQDWIEYVEICGWALARAHARTGDAALIAGYLGKKDTFDEAIEQFAVSYANQIERDYQALIRAIKARRVPASANLAA
jgi:uncharacterized protein (DUF2252 family)